MEISEKERDAGLEITITLTAEDEELMCFPLRWKWVFNKPRRVLLWEIENDFWMDGEMGNKTIQNAYGELWGNGAFK